MSHKTDDDESQTSNSQLSAHQKSDKTPFFEDGPTFVPQIWEYGNFSFRQSYTHFVAQETSIIRK